ncbi:SRPBCC family protein, partial [Singulisphaera rosea]
RMVRAETDPRVGGTFCFVDRRDGRDIEHLGEYLELERPSRLVFAFCVPMFSSERTRVIVDIVPLDDGGCELTLTHENVHVEYASRTEEGWGKLLDALDATIGAAA